MSAHPRMPRPCSKLAPVLSAVVALSLLVGCSLVGKRARPTPGAPRNLSCLLEYRPDPAHDGPDILFAAVAFPWKEEEFLLSLPDRLFHGTFAPGRHLVKPVQIEGAECESPLWRKGRRLSRVLNARHSLSCRRTGLDAVVFEVETKWGTCRQELAAGDPTPKCVLRYPSDLDEALARMSGVPCNPENGAPR